MFDESSNYMLIISYMRVLVNRFFYIKIASNRGGVGDATALETRVPFGRAANPVKMVSPANQNAISIFSLYCSFQQVAAYRTRISSAAVTVVLKYYAACVWACIFLSCETHKQRMGTVVSLGRP